MDYRRASTSDHKKIMPLAEEFAREQADSHPHFTLSEDYKEYLIAGLAAALGAPTACVVLAETEGQVVGYAIGQLQEPPPVFTPVTYVFLSDLYVQPGFRDQDVEQALVERVRAWGLINGVEEFSSVARVGSAQAKALKSAGYETMQELYFLEMKG